MLCLVFCSMNATNQDETMIETLLSYVGVTENVPESLINAISGLSGSGPAYVNMCLILYIYLFFKDKH